MIAAVVASITITIIIAMNLVSGSSNSLKAQATRFGPLLVLTLGIIGVAFGISFSAALDGSLGAAAYLGIVALIANLAGGVTAAQIR